MSSARTITLITGASAGIGAALARVFAAHDHRVALVARREPELMRLADAIAATGKPRPLVIPLDLAEHQAGDRLAERLEAAGVEPEYIVNNAGIGLLGPAVELDRARQLAVVDLDVRAVTDLSLRWLDSLERHRGGLLNVGSVAAFFPGPGMATYYASKAYVLSFTEALHRELKPRGIRVTALCPGPVPTEFQARAGIPPDHFPRFLSRSAERVAQEGYDGLMRGRRLVVPGAVNKLVTLMPRLFPRAAVLALADESQTRRRRAAAASPPSQTP